MGKKFLDPSLSDTQHKLMESVLAETHPSFVEFCLLCLCVNLLTNQPTNKQRDTSENMAEVTKTLRFVNTMLLTLFYLLSGFFSSTSQGLMNPCNIHTSIQMRDRATLQQVQVPQSSSSSTKTSNQYGKAC